ncbi:MAG: hypothetical protein K6C98_02530 [Treponema sp.]|nr:hypothetical protein [Treponema sp.]
MFEKKNKNNILNLFEQVEADSSEFEDDEIKWSVKETVISFIKGFRNKSLMYQMVWSIRILFWILILIIAAYGAFIRIKSFF